MADPDEKGHLHSLGTEKRSSWDNNIDFEIMLENIDNLVKKLMKKFPSRINFRQIMAIEKGPNAISKNMIYVWAANYKN